jgi:oxygen-independent coproporphyrinogen-3 oxidase
LPLGVYVHVPFCRVRCAYCDFAILTRQEPRIPEYVAGLEREIARFAADRGRRTVDTLYFGGGTPSRLPGEALARLVAAVEQHLDAAVRSETSLEANPEDVHPERVAEWRAAGIDRVTLGVQSLDDGVLAAMGRPGNRKESLAALETLLGAGLCRVGVDLIFGGPGQTLAGWRAELDELLTTGVGHLSCYALETTGRTPLVRAVERGEAAVASDELMARMYEHAVERLAAAGLRRYEISNFARPGQESDHNLKHWTDAPYAGFGLSAASYVDGERWTNPRRFQEYLRAATGEGAPPASEPHEPVQRAGEALMLGLRRPEGVDLVELEARYGAAALARREPVLARAEHRGLLAREGRRVRLTGPGMLLADEVFVDLL